MMINVKETLEFVQLVHAIKELKQQNAELVEALGAILNSNAKPVYGIGGKKIKGFTLYLPKERYEKAWRALALVEGEQNG